MEKAIVLGGTAPHIELIRQLKVRGYYVILVDYLPNPPAKGFADLHIMESTLDQEKVLEIAKKYDVSLVISACVDQANVTACYVAEQLDLPHPYSFETALNVTNKGRMKTIMEKNDIATSAFFLISDVKHFDLTQVSYPAVIKPVDCNSSKGVCRVDTEEEAIKAVESALVMSRSRCAVIEKFYTGCEIQVDCFAQDSGAMILMSKEKKRILSENMEELNSCGSIVPFLSSKERKEELIEIARKIAVAFQLRNTLFFFQAILCDDRIIRVLEFAPRIGGGLSYYMMREIVNIDPIKMMIDSYLGIPIRPKPSEIKRHYSTNLLYMEEGVFDHVEGLKDLKLKNIIKEYFIMQEKGQRNSGSLQSGSRVGAFFVEADSLAELKVKEQKAYDKIEIIDDMGQNRIRKMHLM